MIRPCTDADVPVILDIINDAAQIYHGAIPEDCWHDPYMSPGQLARDRAAGVMFIGWEHDGRLIGVMGLQLVRDVALIRHAYVRPVHQGKGIGGALLAEMRRRSHARMLIGTWADAVWAIRFYERHGFQLVPGPEADRLLHAYWDVPERQREVAVVLEAVDQR